MKMVGKQGPSITGRLGLGQNETESFKKIIPVIIVCEYRTTFDPSGNNVMKGAGCIDSGFTGHIPLHRTQHISLRYNMIYVPKVVARLLLSVNELFFLDLR